MSASLKGFSLIELLIVILIVGILSALAVPLYLSYVLDAKLAEGKLIAGSLWTAVQAAAITSCGVPTPVSQGFSRAGLNETGASPPNRWQADGGANTLTVACGTGAYTASAAPLFSLAGLQADIVSLRVGLFYNTELVPPSQLRCTKDGSAPTMAAEPC